MPPKFVDYKKQVDDFLLNFLSEEKERLENVNGWGRDIESKLAKFVINGKTIRGSLVLFAAELWGGEITNDALRTAASMELVHSGLLIHDDIIDQDRTRRGAKTLYVQYEDSAVKLHIDEAKRYGEGMALCIGDITFFLATHLLSQCEKAEVGQKILLTLSREYQAVCFAQMQDVYFGFSQALPRESDVLSVYRYKTARYTFSLPLIVGSILAGAPADGIEKLERIGERVGILFQYKDDLLNLFGDTAKTGKPVGSDIRENKKTVAFTYLFSQISTQERELLSRLQANKSAVDSYIKYVYTLLKQYSVEQYLTGKINQLDKQAQNEIQSLDVSENNKLIFRDIINFIKTREY